MIKKFSKDSRGITLIALMIAVLVIIILTNVVVFNVRDNLVTTKLKGLQEDIANLRDKVSEYYSKYDAIPIGTEYTNVDHIKSSGVISEVSDTGKFYVLKLSKLENLILNYGKDYEKITDTMTTEQVNEYEDLYIINETSHNIFYVKGIKVHGDLHYTDYSADDIDTEEITLKYIETVKIPNGFYYVAGTKDTGIIISDVKGDDIENSKKGNQYVWVPVENFDEFVREDYGIQNIKETDFIDTDKTIEKYYEETSNGEMTETEAEKMYNSVKLNKGFYIARFEAGKTENGEVVSKKDETVYNKIKWGNSSDELGGAVEKARSVYKENDQKSDVVSTLCYGVQWDAIMRWISKDNSLVNDLKDSSKVGNYSNNETPNKTGANDEYQIKNIYDLAGNVGEWTMENYNKNNYVIRGGDFSKTDSYAKSMSTRIGGTLEYEDESIGFRVALYLKNKEEWSNIYQSKNGNENSYKDEYGNEVYIPSGFQVSKQNSSNSIKEGLVIKNAVTQDRYVWVAVPKSVFLTAENEKDYTAIEADLKEYTLGYSDSNYSDTYYKECGLESEAKYNELKNKMLSSLYINKGFWISQYEIGSGSFAKNSKDTIERNSTSQENQYVYNYITVADAQSIATNIASGERTSSLLFGVQWDLACKFVSDNSIKNVKESKDWGNYKDSIFTVRKGKYINLIQTEYNSEITDKYDKKEEEILFTTGVTTRNSALNIYDLAGNVAEWTLEKGQDDMSVARGGSFKDENSGVVDRISGYEDKNIGFRIAIY